jgi:hypothetical protein
MKKILIDAAAIGNAAARAISFSPRHPGLYTYGKDSGWYRRSSAGTPPTRRTAPASSTAGSSTTSDTSAFLPPWPQGPGKGSDYWPMGMVDSKGRPLDGSKTYRLRLPPDIPVKDFWALTMYDTQTRCQLQTDQRFPTLDSYREGMKKNADGSIDVYFSPKAPKGQESNWLQTIPGKAGSSRCACTARSSPGSTRPGGPARSSWWSDVPEDHLSGVMR